MNIMFVRAASAWTPAKLFASGEKGVWYDPSDFSTMWQNTARTTPVTATGQSVACIDDKSGNGAHATQATSSLRPVLQQDAGGRYYLEFDGTDDTISSSSISFAGATGTEIQGRRDVGTTRFVPTWMDGSNFWGISESGSGLSPGLGSSYEVNTVVVSPFTRGAVYTAVNGKNVVFVAKGIVLPTGTYDINGFAGHMLNSRMYGNILIDRALTTGEIASAVAWMNGKTGAY